MMGNPGHLALAPPSLSWNMASRNLLDCLLSFVFSPYRTNEFISRRARGSTVCLHKEPAVLENLQTHVGFDKWSALCRLDMRNRVVLQSCHTRTKAGNSCLEHQLQRQLPPSNRLNTFILARYLLP